MWRYGLSFLIRTAAVVGGVILYTKYGPRKHRAIVGLASGLVVGQQYGTLAGLAIAGPLGGAIGSVAGAATGAVLGHGLAVGDVPDLAPVVA